MATKTTAEKHNYRKLEFKNQTFNYGSPGWPEHDQIAVYSSIEGMPYKIIYVPNTIWKDARKHAEEGNGPRTPGLHTYCKFWAYVYDEGSDTWLDDDHYSGYSSFGWEVECPPHYKATYYPNQLVASFYDKHQTIAKLKEDGSIEWDTKPNLYLESQHTKEQVKEDKWRRLGKILQIRAMAPNYFSLQVQEHPDYPHRLRSVGLATQQKDWIPKEKPWKHEDKLVILDPEWRGMTLSGRRGNSSTYKIRKLIERPRASQLILGDQTIPSLLAIFGSYTVVQDVHKENKDGTENPNKLESRRILHVAYHRKANKLVTDIDSHSPLKGEIEETHKDHVEGFKAYGTGEVPKIVRFRIAKEN